VLAASPVTLAAKLAGVVVAEGADADGVCREIVKIQVDSRCGVGCHGKGRAHHGGTHSGVVDHHGIVHCPGLGDRLAVRVAGLADHLRHGLADHADLPKCERHDARLEVAEWDACDERPEESNHREDGEGLHCGWLRAWISKWWLAGAVYFDGRVSWYTDRGLWFYWRESGHYIVIQG